MEEEYVINGVKRALNEDEKRLGLIPTKGKLWRPKKKPKKKPLTMKNFFATTTNSQGFGMHLCRYEKSIGDHVYVPPKYGKLSKGRAFWLNQGFCSDCKLQPCITVEHHEEIKEKLMDHHDKDDRAINAGKKPNNVTLLNKSERSILTFMTKYFGGDYAKRVGTPCCVMKAAHQFNREWLELVRPRRNLQPEEDSSSSSGSSSEEDEEEDEEPDCNNREEEEPDCSSSEEENEF